MDFAVKSKLLKITKYMGYLETRWDEESPSKMQTHPLTSSKSLCEVAERGRRHASRRPKLSVRLRANYAGPSGTGCALGSKLSTFLAALFLAVSVSAQAATINALSPSFADVSTAVGSAKNGDTVIVPAGTASWTSPLVITKGIILMGRTTISNAGKSTASANDQTVIRNNNTVTSAPGLISATLTASQSLRITGITFQVGTSTNVSNTGIVTIRSQDTSPSMNVRIDDCHFDRVLGHNICILGWIYGVADHNLFSCQQNAATFWLQEDAYGGKTLGHGAYADYPWFGTNKFFFIETNTIVGNGVLPTSGTIDSGFGARWVARYNCFINAKLGGHGTEGNSRGTRAKEVYNNQFHWTGSLGSESDSWRSGSGLVHDNSYDGNYSGSGFFSAIQNYRSFSAVWNYIAPGVADGSSHFDERDTVGNGNYVQGQKAFVFDSGTTNASNTTGNQFFSINGNQLSVAYGTVVDTTKHWTANQWVGFSVRSPNFKNGAPSPLGNVLGTGSQVIHNTSNTIYYSPYTGGDRGPKLLFPSGTPYQIMKPLSAVDQAGRGKGNLITGGTTWTNSVTGGPDWPHQALEPIFFWNNIYTPKNQVQGAFSKQLSVQPGRDFYNLTGANSNGSFAANSTPSQVSTKYSAALNGVQYTGPYIYPHPLTNNIAPPSNLAIVP